MARMTGDTAELVAERDGLEARLLDLRRVGKHRTRESALGRVDLSLAEASAALDELAAECRHRLATRNVALPIPMLLELAALTALRDSPAVGELLRAEIRRPANVGEGDPFADEAVAERGQVEERLEALQAELELRGLEAEAGELKERQETIEARIGGGA